MGNLIETVVWSAGIPYFDADAILTGGPDCPDNIPIQALANRTAFLKKQIDDAVSGALTVMYANRLKTARTISMSGDGTWSVSFDGNGNVTSAMTLANTTVVAGTYPVITVDGKGRATAGRALQSADLPASPALTGTPTVPTAAAGTNTTQIASTAFVQAAVAALIASSPAALDTLNELAAALGDDPNFATTMTNALAAKAPLASPALTGNPTAPTPTNGDNDTSLATTAFVQALVNGRLSKLVAGGATVTLTAAEAGYGIIEFTGALTANIAVVVPNASGQWIFKNATTGPYTLTVKTAAGTGVAITQGSTWQLYCDGTNVVNAISDFKDIALTGVPTAPTAAPGTNSTQLANTAFVQAKAIAHGLGGAALSNNWDTLTGGLYFNDSSSATGIPFASTNMGVVHVDTGPGYAVQLAMRTGADMLLMRRKNGGAWSPWTSLALLASPAFTGIPTAPTAAAGTNTTQLANTAFVQAAIAALVASSPAALDTLNELAAALCNDPNFATTITNALALKAPLASPALTGTPTVPTAAAGANTTQAASTAFVQQELAAKAPLASPTFTGDPKAPTPDSGDNDTSLATTAFVQLAANGLLTKSVAGGANVTLTAAEAGYATIKLTGALTANIAVIVPNTAARWTIWNATTGNYTVTVKTSAGTGIIVTQGATWPLLCDATNVIDANSDFKDIALTGVSTAPTAAAGTNTTQLANTAFVQAALTERQKMLLSASQAATSGTFLDFTGIPAWANRVTVLINGVSTNGNSQVLIQVGTSGGVVATGYVATANDDGTGTPTTTGFPTGQTDSAGGPTAVRYSRLVLERQAGNNWLGFGQTYNSVVASAVYQLGGLIALGGVLDRVRVTTVNGTDAFDAGAVSLLIEGN